MGFKQAMHCDECDTQKKDANHWFTVGQSHMGITLNTFEKSQQDPELLKVLLLYCGQSCLNKAVQRWMDTGQVEKQDAGVPEDVAELTTTD